MRSFIGARVLLVTTLCAMFPPGLEHSTHADKFIYEAELRTGMGAHYRYAEHLSAALHEFFVQVPEAQQWVVEGTAEPE